MRKWVDQALIGIASSHQSSKFSNISWCLWMNPNYFPGQTPFHSVNRNLNSNIKLNKDVMTKKNMLKLWIIGYVIETIQWYKFAPPPSLEHQKTFPLPPRMGGGQFLKMYTLVFKYSLWSCKSISAFAKKLSRKITF